MLRGRTVESLAGLEPVVRASVKVYYDIVRADTVRQCNHERGQHDKIQAQSQAHVHVRVKTQAQARHRRSAQARDRRPQRPRASALYGEDAVVQVIDRDNPPSKPRKLEGRSAISAYFDDVYGRDMTHKIESGVAVGKRLAFTQSCAYPDGTRVFCSAMIELKGGKIARQIVVQAWDG